MASLLLILLLLFSSYIRFIIISYFKKKKNGSRCSAALHQLDKNNNTNAIFLNKAFKSITLGVPICPPPNPQPPGSPHGPWPAAPLVRF